MEPSGDDVRSRLDSVTPAVRRRDAETLVAMMREVTGREPIVWSGGIVGFGSVHYRYPTGTEGDAPIVGFAPRKSSTTVYLLDGVDAHAPALEQLGPHTTGTSCLYVKDLDSIDTAVLRDILAASHAWVLDGGSDSATMTVTK